MMTKIWNILILRIINDIYEYLLQLYAINLSIQIKFRPNDAFYPRYIIVNSCVNYLAIIIMEIFYAYNVIHAFLFGILNNQSAANTELE